LFCGCELYRRAGQGWWSALENFVGKGQGGRLFHIRHLLCQTSNAWRKGLHDSPKSGVCWRKPKFGNIGYENGRLPTTSILQPHVSKMIPKVTVCG
jgi:hypothetical protein